MYINLLHGSGLTRNLTLMGICTQYVLYFHILRFYFVGQSLCNHFVELFRIQNVLVVYRKMTSDRFPKQTKKNTFRYSIDMNVCIKTTNDKCMKIKTKVKMQYPGLYLLVVLWQLLWSQTL